MNATLNANFADAVAKNCPDAMVAIISNPVNSTVPIFAEQMKKNGCYDPKKPDGTTWYDNHGNTCEDMASCRAETLVAPRLFLQLLLRRHLRIAQWTQRGVLRLLDMLLQLDGRVT